MTVKMIACENQPETVFLEAYGKAEGSAEYQIFGEHKGQWMVSISKAYNAETDSDCQFIGYFADKQQALMELELAYTKEYYG